MKRKTDCPLCAMDISRTRFRERQHCPGREEFFKLIAILPRQTFGEVLARIGRAAKRGCKDTDAAHPQTQASDQKFTVTPDAPSGLRYDVSSRTCHLCVDGTGGDYSLGGTYGDEVTQVFGVIPDDDSIWSPDTSQYGNGDIYYYGPSIYFSASGQSTMLSKPVWTGTFYYQNDKTDPAAGASDIFGHSLENGPGPPRDGLSFTGTNEVPALSNSNWLISYESVWSFRINPGPDLWPGHPVTRLKYFPMASPPAGVLSGGTRFPDSLNGGALAISRATQASDDMVALTGTSGGYYVWNFPNAQAQPIVIHDTLLGISTRYLTPPPTASGTTPVPDFQVLGRRLSMGAGAGRDDRLAHHARPSISVQPCRTCSRRRPTGRNSAPPASTMQARSSGQRSPWTSTGTSWPMPTAVISSMACSYSRWTLRCKTAKLIMASTHRWAACQLLLITKRFLPIHPVSRFGPVSYQEARAAS